MTSDLSGTCEQSLFSGLVPIFAGIKHTATAEQRHMICIQMEVRSSYIELLLYKVQPNTGYRERNSRLTGVMGETAGVFFCLVFSPEHCVFS